MTEPFKDLFDHLHETEDQAEAALEALGVADIATRKAREAIWAAIDQTIAANADHEDVRDAVRRLEAQVLELMNRLPPAPEKDE